MATSKDENTCSESYYFDGLPVTGFHKKIFWIIMLAYFFEQMDNWNFGFVAPSIFDSWGLSGQAADQAMSKILSWYFIGMTLGGLLGGVISDAIGRRKTFLFSIVLFSSCSIINGLPIDDLNVFIIARTLTGFGVFCLMVCSQTYIAEMSPAEDRGKWQGLIAAVGFCAVPFISFLCFLIVPLSKDAWRLIFYSGGLGFVGLAFALVYLKESPRWLVAKNRKEEAADVIKEITGQDVSLDNIPDACKEHLSPFEAFKNIFGSKYIGRTILLLLLFVTIAPAGFIFSTWTPKLLSTIPVIDVATESVLLDSFGKTVYLYDKSSMLILMTIISCGVPGGCYLAALISDKGGRKWPLIITLVFSAIFAVLFSMFSNMFYVTAVLGFLLSVFEIAASFILFSYTAESYPTVVRNTAIGLQNGLARLSVAGFQRVVPMILITYGGTVGLVNYDIPAVFTACAILFIIPVPFVIFFGKRTSGKSLEEIS